MQKYTDVFQDTLGNALTGAAVSVFQQGTSILATIYSDNGVTPAANPLTTDTSTGTFQFYAADGRYDLQAAKTGYITQTKRDVLLFDPNASTGAAYVKFTPSGIASAISSTVATKLQNGVPLDVKSDFGAKGDNSTDDATVLQNALTNLPAGAWLHFPRGTYKSSVGLTRTLPIIITAEPGALLRCTNAAGAHALTIDGTAITNGMNGIAMSDLSISTEAGGGDALRLIWVSRSAFKNIRVPSAASAGVRMLGSLLNSLSAVSVSTNLPYTAGTRAAPSLGIVFDVQTAVASNANALNACSFEGVGTGITNQGNSYGNTFIGGTSEGNTVGANLVSDGTIFIGTDFEANGADFSGTGKYTFLNPITRVFSLPAGAVGAPSFTLGDLTTGLYRPAANQIAVSVSGTQVALFSSGVVSIPAGNWLQFGTKNTLFSSAGAGFFLQAPDVATTVLTVRDNSGTSWGTWGPNGIAVNGFLTVNAAAASQSAGTIAYGATTQTTIGANGAASALTANPLGYIKIFVGTTPAIIPYYNA